jgi:hypothetical protein
MLNGINYLFEREEISPAVVRNIMLYCLDCSNAEGVLGKRGTSRAAMMFLSNWLNGFGEAGQLSISSTYLSGEKVFLGRESRINDALKRGGVAVVRIFSDCDHYVLLTGISGEDILVFDPYYEQGDSPHKDIVWVSDKPFSYNRIVPQAYFNRQTETIYALGKLKEREAVLLFNERTKKTAEATIEYFI